MTNPAVSRPTRSETIGAVVAGVIDGILLAYSEFLDTEGLIVPAEASGDDRSHDDLIQAFLDKS